jgi:signal transduction histidine kinase
MTEQSASGDVVHLRVHPSVVFKLGEEMITDEVQALIELVKNSYDADSPIARVVIDTETVTAVRIGDHVEDLIGAIEIQDRGAGMTRHELIQGWLTVSNSWKRQYKAEGTIPAGQAKPKRTPLGDKGLGRLGAQRLGDVLELETQSIVSSHEAWRAVIPWRLFDTATALDDVPIMIERLRPRSPKAGTTLKILGLKSTLWTRPEAKEELRRDLASLVSPFGQRRGFKIEIVIDGLPLDLYQITSSLRAAAEVTYKLKYENGRLAVQTAIAQDFFRPNLSKDLPDFQHLMQGDKGKRFTDWLFDNKAAALHRLGVIPGKGKHIFETRYEVVAVDHSSTLAFENDAFVDPGPFEAEIDAVDLSSDWSGTFDSRANYRSFVRSVSGIKVYRDGFGIRTPGDWLSLGARWSTGKSYYSLRPDNVIGYIDISVEHNSQLEETTDREGFRSTPAYANFYALLQLWLDYTADLHAVLRRSWLDYVRENRRVEADVEPTTSPEDLLGRVDKTIRELGKSREPLQRARQDLDRISRRSSQIARASGRDQAAQPELELEGLQLSQKLTDLLLAVEETAATVSAATIEVDQIVARAQNDRAAITVVADQIEMLREQLSDAWSTVALGITAEALTHEMLNVVDRLHGQTNTVRRYLKSQQIADTRMLTYLEYVRSAANALNRQLSHLGPGMRYMRDSRDVFRMSAFLKDFRSFFDARYNDGVISLETIVVHDFDISMNRGRLTQVLDNFVLNSEYWIKDLQTHIPFAGQISIELDDPHVIVRDNGPGVVPRVESSLFEAFVTTKPRDRGGRGLGLFVVQQLLNADGCTVRLLPDRDSDGRRRAFEIDLSAVKRDGLL